MGVQVRRKLTLGIVTLLFFTCIPLSLLQAQKGQDTSSFLRDQNRPFVYLKFDHIGVGVHRAADEPTTRIWFQFVNNCTVPIRLRVYGVPNGSLPGEVGVMDDVVRDRPILTITADNSTPEVDHEFRPDNDAVRKTEPLVPQRTEMPSGYMSEVSGAVIVAPGGFVLFSVPTTHLGGRGNDWHMEIPFWFDAPKGRGLRDEVVGGEPVMSLRYAYYDLPESAKNEMAKMK